MPNSIQTLARLVARAVMCLALVASLVPLALLFLLPLPFALAAEAACLFCASVFFALTYGPSEIQDLQPRTPIALSGLVYFRRVFRRLKPHLGLPTPRRQEVSDTYWMYDLKTERRTRFWLRGLYMLLSASIGMTLLMSRDATPVVVACLAMQAGALLLVYMALVLRELRRRAY